ncbi:MAG TPA: hypothetical protein VLF59_05205 [Candidatus Saccharimonadales bacterium]|nr:hypothetical protein [Candidatus Saccharimonadales bacterium]
MQKKPFQLAVLVGVLALGVLVLTKHQGIEDWWRLRNYVVPADVAAFVSEDAMTDQARTLLYVNHPDITQSSTFGSHCPTGTEKTIVLGCYIGNDGGIYIYKVTDTRLNGVEQVTAAHEMLHAAYRRLSGSERKKVDVMLTDYYAHELTDQRIRDTIEAYKKSEPNDVVNEMHSVFGTEITQLPLPLEQYYQRYFTDRSKVTGMAASYQGEFTGRRQLIARYDTQLAALKPQITADESQLESQRVLLEKQSQQLDSYRASGQVAAYNAAVPVYNLAVDSYNGLRGTTKALITQYNAIVEERNAVALEEQQLTQELSSSALPKSQ